ncbi:MAG: uracil-DNA glycosylase [Amylibacter sp.]|mgnify:FL=1|jgi:uracil-DNA glycosylase family 4|tara:strand:+ start:15529 stop:16323 length:795 start_codon:yes stop_codon:yes gene_type:complete
MSHAYDYYATKSALEWQLEIGVDEAICDIPINRYEEQAIKPKLKITATSNITSVKTVPNIFPVKEAAKDLAGILAAKCNNLSELRDAMGLFDLCALKKGARNLVFSDGPDKACVMVIAEAPTREEDIEGKPFVGTEGILIDKMFQAIGLSRNTIKRDEAIHIAKVMPWRPPQSRDPNAEEIAMMLPFLKRHVELVNPDFVVLMGNVACSAVLNKVGINRFRGQWADGFGKPALPMLHPRALIREPIRKRDAWDDLLTLKSRILS